MNPCILIHGYGLDRLARDRLKPAPLTPEERSDIEEVASVAESAQFDLLMGLQGLGRIMWSAAHKDEDVDRESLASCGYLVHRVAEIIDGFRLLEGDLNFRLRRADQAPELAPGDSKADARPPGRKA